LTDTIGDPATLDPELVKSASVVLAELVTLAQWATLAGLKRQTMDAYRLRGRLPLPIGYVGNSPVWLRSLQVDPWNDAHKFRRSD
jgi:hypothetical protein